tara:strand:+ start:54495 stop:56978 length:2484 start_codon:yes stop_codon:yes gene_type:complete
MKLIVVESPSKAKTLKAYLDSEYEVIASIGHFRDLPKSGIGIEETEDFNVKKWEIDNEKINPIIKLVKNAEEIFLAPDPDREGELIAWHLLEICKEKNLLNGKKISRIEFNQVNKDTVLKAIENPRDININLVNAAIARRFLDRFFGYRISPITQRRTIFGKSAGRVQSPALRILANREMEIDQFTPKEYWEIETILRNKEGKSQKFKLFMRGEEKIKKLSISSIKSADILLKELKEKTFIINKIEKKQKKRSPYPPYSASTLLQDASSKLGFSSSLTTSLAQQLFDGSAYKDGEQGLITYPRSDFIVLNKEKIHLSRKIIFERYGDKYLPKSENIFKNKAKFAQESHEPINPVNLELYPNLIKGKVNQNQFKLYELIWNRTIASQMLPSINQETTIFVSADEFKFKASGTILVFDGFKKVYNFSDSDEESKNKIPIFTEKYSTKPEKIEKNQFFTSPPKRYSEAGLIKKLEELGIGRPSTYASIIKKLKEKDYVQVRNKSMVPNAKGKILSKFLESYFNNFVEYEFTASLEKQLDQITKAEIEWKVILKNFLEILNETVSDVEKMSITNVIDHINEKSSELLKEKKCPKCKNGRQVIKFAFSGPFIGCSNYSKDSNGCKFSQSLDEEDTTNFIDGEKILGTHPVTKKPIKIKKGRYGLYLEIEESESKIKRTAVPKNVDFKQIDVSKALDLLKLPREIGFHPDSKKKITAAIGPFGPYIKHDKKPTPTYVNLKDDDVLYIGLNRAIELISEKERLLKGIELGTLPNSNKTITIKKGKFGYYLEIGTEDNEIQKLSLPRNLKIEDISLKDALLIIDEKTKKTKKKKK